MKTIILITQALLLCSVLLQIVWAKPVLHKTRDGKRYYVIETEPQFNWYEAGRECARRDAQLLIIDSEDKNNAIISMLENAIKTPYNLWLGGNDEFSSSRDYKRPFFWSATGKKFTFTFWSDKNPDNDRRREHCVHIWDAKPNYQWNDIDCTTKMGYICEDNIYLERYYKNWTNVCDAVKNTTSSIIEEFDEVQEKQTSELNEKVEDINREVNDLKTELEQMQSDSEAAIQKMINEQRNTVRTITKKMLQQVGDLNGELKKSNAKLNEEFGAKLEEKQNDINAHCL